MARINILRDRKAALLKEAEGLGDKQATGTLTEAEDARYTAIEAELKTLNAAIAREERLMDERRTMDAVRNENEETPQPPAPGRVEVVKPTETFASLGEQLQAIAFAGRPGVTSQEWDRRLVPLWRPGGMSAAASGANETVPAEGGFLVSQQVGSPLIQQLFEGGQILSRVRHLQIGVGYNGAVIPALDERSRANGSRWGGVQVYWAAEADTVAASKPKFRNIDLKLKKLMGIAYATDELLQDAPLIEQIFNTAFSEEMTFKIEDGIINGVGVTEMTGIMGSAALVNQAAVVDQPGGTISTVNVLGMFGALPPRSLTRAVWLVNPEALPQLQQLVLGDGIAVVRLFSLPQGDQNNSLATGAGTLLGRPVIPCEYCSALGTPGDIMLVDLDQYIVIDKGGLNQASSIHVRFLNDETAFRWTYRIDGQPIQIAPVTPYKGAVARSPYVALAERAIV